MKKKMPKSIRKYIREEKARIRRDNFDVKEQNKKINNLYQKFQKEEIKDENTGNLQSGDK